MAQILPALATVAGDVGSVASSAAGALGSGLESAASTLGSLFTGGGAADAAGAEPQAVPVRCLRAPRAHWPAAVASCPR